MSARWRGPAKTDKETTHLLPPFFQLISILFENSMILQLAISHERIISSNDINNFDDDIIIIIIHFSLNNNKLETVALIAGEDMLK